MSEPLSSKINCPAANICEETMPGGPRCGTEALQLRPLIPAEKVCLTALRSYIETSHSTDGSSASELAYYGSALELAWYYAELAGRKETVSEDSAKYIRDASMLSSSILAQNNTSLDIYDQAQLLNMYAPTAAQRRKGLSPASESLRPFRLGLLDLYQKTLNAPIHTRAKNEGHFDYLDHQPCLPDEKIRIFFKQRYGLGLLALSKGILLNPASYREIRSPGQSVRHEHHNYYLLDKGDKLAIKISYNLANTKYTWYETGDALMRISPQHLVQLAYEELGVGLIKEDAQEKTLQLLDDVYARYSGKPVSQATIELISAVGDQLKSAIRDFKTAKLSHDNAKEAIQESSESLNVTETTWTILPRGKRATIDDDQEDEPAVTFIPEKQDSETRKIDHDRLIKLAALANEWGGDSYLAVANMKRNGDFDYVAAVLPEQTGARVIEHAVAENPGINNAMFVYRAEKGQLSDGQETTWRDVLSASKDQAIDKGARRIVHSKHSDEYVLEYLTRPAIQLAQGLSNL